MSRQHPARRRQANIHPASEPLERRLLFALGDLDPSFSGDGRQVIDVTAGADAATALALTGAGQILVAGNTAGVEQRGSLQRLYANGDVDNTFGPAVIDFSDAGTPGAASRVSDVLVAGPGRILVGGTRVWSGPLTDFAVMARLSGGGLDTGFGGGDGLVIADFAGEADYANDMALTSWGAILAAGSAEIIRGGSTWTDFAVARFTSTGALDTSFGGGDGLVNTPIGTFAEARALVVLPDDRFVLVGRATIGGIDQVAVARYAANGALDTSFSGDGIVTMPVGTLSSGAVDVRALSTGDLLVACTASIGGDQVFAVVRVDHDGELVTGFGVGGVAFDQWPSVNMTSEATCMDLLPGGQIVVGGIHSVGGNSTFGMCSFLLDGTLDTSFGISGHVSTDFGFGPDGAHAISSFGGDKIVLAGFGNDLNLSQQFAVARYLAYPILPDRFEPNDSFLHATDLGQLGYRVETSLTLHPLDSDDFFLYTAGLSGTATVELDFTHAFGDVDLYIYNAAQVQIAASAGTSDHEECSFAVTAGQNYYVRVNGYAGATCPSYQLRIDSPHDSTPPRVTSAEFLFDRPPQALRFTFSEEVGASLGRSDLRVASGAQSLEFDAPTYDPHTNTATFVYGGVVPEGHWVASLLASGITDAAGNPLDGNGDGTGGDDFTFDFTFFRGDMNRDNHVNNQDVAPFVLGLTDPTGFINTWGYRPYTIGDVNGDSAFDNQDIAPFVARLTAGRTPPSSPRPTRVIVGLFADRRLDRGVCDDADAGLEIRATPGE